MGDAIRDKTGKNELFSLDEIPAEIAAIETGIKTDDATATAGDILSGKTAYVKDEKITGTMHIATQATPTISVSSAGLITASAIQTAGYVAAGTKSATQQLTVQGAQTITPGTANKTIASGRYLTGTQTIAGDADLKSANIKKGVNIFGVAGSYEGVELNFNVVGGTTQPSSASENTIWVNTSTTITSWVFSSTQPSNPTEGMVWFFTAAPSTIKFNALKKNGIEVYPITARQYLGGAWVNRTAKIQQNGKLEELMLLLYRPGDECTDITGGWVARAVPRASGGTAKNPTITRKEDSISFQLVADRGTSGVVNLVNKIDLTGKKVIRFYGSKSGASTSDTCRLRLWSALGSYSDANVVAEINLHSYSNFEQEPIAIDISGLTSGSYYLGIAFRSYESARPVITFNRIEVA